MSNCEICGEPMPVGEEMFKFHGYSCDCPKPPLQKIKGYRDLSEAEIGLINSVKLHAESVGQQIAALEQEAGIDKRWLAIAKTDLQKGFMALVRSIAQPTTF